jgi:transcriptional regulator with XRE-family HTH domain
VTPGQLLRDARLRHFATQQQLAARARTSQAQISRIERDQTSPSVKTLANLLDLLGEELELTSKPVDDGYDVARIRATLELTPAQRLQANTDDVRAARELRGTMPER